MSRRKKKASVSVVELLPVIVDDDQFTNKSKCYICNSPDDEDLTVLCDGSLCNNEAHMYCLNPVLTNVPEGDWLCDFCDTSKEYRQLLLYLNDFESKYNIPTDNVYYKCWLECLQHQYLPENELSRINSIVPYLSDYLLNDPELIGLTVALVIDEATLRCHTGRIVDRRVTECNGRWEHLIQFKSGGDGRNKPAVRWLCLEEHLCVVHGAAVWIRCPPAYTAWWPALTCRPSGLYRAFASRFGSSGSSSNDKAVFFVPGDDLCVELSSAEVGTSVVEFSKRAFRASRHGVGKRLSVAVAAVGAELQMRLAVRRAACSVATSLLHSHGCSVDGFTAQDLRNLADLQQLPHDTAEQPPNVLDQYREIASSSIVNCEWQCKPAFRTALCSPCSGVAAESLAEPLPNNSSSDSVPDTVLGVDATHAEVVDLGAEVGGGVGGAGSGLADSDADCSSSVERLVSALLDRLVEDVVQQAATSSTNVPMNCESMSCDVEGKTTGESTAASSPPPYSPPSDALHSLLTHSVVCADLPHLLDGAAQLVSPNATPSHRAIFCISSAVVAAQMFTDPHLVSCTEWSATQTIGSHYSQFVAQQQAQFELRRENERLLREEKRRQKALNALRAREVRLGRLHNLHNKAASGGEQEILVTGSTGLTAPSNKTKRKSRSRGTKNNEQNSNTNKQSSSSSGTAENGGFEDESLFLMGDITRRSLRRFLRHTGGSVDSDVLDSLLGLESGSGSNAANEQSGPERASAPIDEADAPPRSRSSSAAATNASSNGLSKETKRLRKDVQQLVLAQEAAPVLLSDLDRAEWTGTVVTDLVSREIGRVVHFQSGWNVVRTLTGVIRSRPYELEVLPRDSATMLSFEDAEILLIDQEPGAEDSRQHDTEQRIVEVEVEQIFDAPDEGQLGPYATVSVANDDELFTAFLDEFAQLDGEEEELFDGGFEEFASSPGDSHLHQGGDEICVEDNSLSFDADVFGSLNLDLAASPLTKANGSTSQQQQQQQTTNTQRPSLHQKPTRIKYIDTLPPTVQSLRTNKITKQTTTKQLPPTPQISMQAQKLPAVSRDNLSSSRDGSSQLLRLPEKRPMDPPSDMHHPSSKRRTRVIVTDEGEEITVIDRRVEDEEQEEEEIDSFAPSQQPSMPATVATHRPASGASSVAHSAGRSEKAEAHGGKLNSQNVADNYNSAKASRSAEPSQQLSYRPVTAWEDQQRTAPLAVPVQGNRFGKDTTLKRERGLSADFQFKQTTNKTAHTVFTTNNSSHNSHSSHNNKSTIVQHPQSSKQMQSVANEGGAAQLAMKLQQLANRAPSTNKDAVAGAGAGPAGPTACSGPVVVMDQDFNLVEVPPEAPTDAPFGADSAAASGDDVDDIDSFIRSIQESVGYTVDVSATVTTTTTTGVATGDVAVNTAHQTDAMQWTSPPFAQPHNEDRRDHYHFEKFHDSHRDRYSSAEASHSGMYGRQRPSDSFGESFGAHRRENNNSASKFPPLTPAARAAPLGSLGFHSHPEYQEYHDEYYEPQGQQQQFSVRNSVSLGTGRQNLSAMERDERPHNTSRHDELHHDMHYGTQHFDDGYMGEWLPEALLDNGNSHHIHRNYQQYQYHQLQQQSFESHDSHSDPYIEDFFGDLFDSDHHSGMHSAQQDFDPYSRHPHSNQYPLTHVSPKGASGRKSRFSRPDSVTGREISNNFAPTNDAEFLHHESNTVPFNGSSYQSLGGKRHSRFEPTLRGNSHGADETSASFFTGNHPTNSSQPPHDAQPSLSNQPSRFPPSQHRDQHQQQQSQQHQTAGGGARRPSRFQPAAAKEELPAVRYQARQPRESRFEPPSLGIATDVRLHCTDMPAPGGEHTVTPRNYVGKSDALSHSSSAGSSLLRGDFTNNAHSNADSSIGHHRGDDAHLSGWRPHNGEEAARAKIAEGVAAHEARLRALRAQAEEGEEIEEDM